MVTSEQAAYLAGFFDGEGCVHVRKDGYVELKIVNTVKARCEDFLVFGGTVSPRRHHRENQAPTWVWTAVGKNALAAGAALIPYLRTKHIPIDVGLRRARAFKGFLALAAEAGPDAVGLSGSGSR